MLIDYQTCYFIVWELSFIFGSSIKHKQAHRSKVPSYKNHKSNVWKMRANFPVFSVNASKLYSSGGWSWKCVCIFFIFRVNARCYMITPINRLWKSGEMANDLHRVITNCYGIFISNDMGIKSYFTAQFPRTCVIGWFIYDKKIW